MNTMPLADSQMTLLCRINGYGKSFKSMCPGELETKLEHSGRHATF